MLHPGYQAGAEERVDQPGVPLRRGILRDGTGGDEGVGGAEE